MEVFNNIWNALTTENELLINIIFMFLVFLESFVMYSLFTSILRIKSTKEQSFTFTCIFAIICVLAYYFIPAPFYSIFDYIIMFVLLKKIFKLSTLKSILAIICSFAIYGLVGNLILTLLIKFLNIGFNEINLIPIYRLLYLFTSYICLLLISRIIKIRLINFKIFENIIFTNKILITNLVLGLITLSLQLFITFYYISSYPIGFGLLNLICLFVYLVVSFISLNRTVNLQIKTQQLENAESYNNSLQTLYDSVRGFKHDLNNIIDSIGGYVESKDIPGLEKYYKGLRKDCVRVNNIEILNPNIINNPGIYGLIVSKQNKASELKVNISLEVFFDFKNIKMPIYEFSRILGILLDNAIEAASECTEKQVNLMFRESRKNHTQIICIENTYNNKDVDTKTIFEKGVSGKENHTGIGLWEVNQIISKNNNIVLHTSKNDKYFNQQLEIYY